MPLYDYRCADCGHVVEVRHGFDEAHDGRCPQCGGVLKRVFNPAPIVFKGSGFYVTDSRPPKTAKSAAGGDGPSKTDSKSGDAKPAESAPSAPKAPEPSAGASSKGDSAA